MRLLCQIAAPGTGALRKRSTVRPLRTSRPLTLGFLGCFLFSLAAAFAQSATNNAIKNFRAPLQYFDPPHELQVKSFLAGTQAELGPDGLIFIRDAKLQIFHEDGTIDMTITAPQCTFDSKQHTVSSAGPLQLQSSDDKLLHEGKGFLWRETNSDLIVSNFVSTTVRGRLTNSFTP